MYNAVRYVLLTNEADWCKNHTNTLGKLGLLNLITVAMELVFILA